MLKTRGFIIFLILSLGVIGIFGQNTFQARFKITHIERNQASMAGMIYYKSSLNKFRLNYDSGQMEWYDATKDVRTRKCTTDCKEIPYFENNPEFYTTVADVAGSDIIMGEGANARNCKIYNKAQTPTQVLQWVATDASGLVCGALLKNGIQFTFSEVNSNSTIEDSYLDASLSCQSATEQCNSKLDIYFIGDESGSVTSAGFTQEINFMTQMVNLLDVKPGGVHVGLTFFSNTSSLVQELTGDKARLISALNAKAYAQGYTCISCGIDQASVNFEGGLSRAGVPKVYIVLTDGKNNRPEPQNIADQRLVESANRSKGIIESNGGAVVAIGVGSDFNIADLQKIATKDKYILQVTNFDGLQGITNDVLTSACEDSDYICDSCPTGFCLCGTCQGCPGGCPGTDNVVPIDQTLSAGAIAGIVVGGVAFLAAAIGSIVFLTRKKEQPSTTETPEEPERKTIDIEDRSERYSKLVRKFSVNDNKKVNKVSE